MEAFHSEPLKYITDSVIEVFHGLYDPKNTAWFDRRMEALFRVEQSTIESDNNVWVVPSEKIVSSYIPKAETTVPMLVDFLSDALSRAKESDHRNYTYGDYNRIVTYELALEKWETAYWYYNDMADGVEPQPTKSAANFKNAAGSPQAVTGEPQRPTVPMEGEKAASDDSAIPKQKGKPGRKQKPWSGCVINGNEWVTAQLHNLIDGKKDSGAVLYIAAARSNRLITKPTYTQFKEEFGEIATKAIYNKYIDTAIWANNTDFVAAKESLK